MLKTRFHKPKITSDIINRERIVSFLNKNSDKTLILVSAPAGYGKSMAISQWIEMQNNPYSWLSIDKSFNNLTVFLEYFTEALSNLRPSQRENFKALVNASTILSTEAIAEKVCNVLSEREEEGVLVLDDYYYLSDPSIHELLNYLLDNIPVSQQLVIISRFDPPLKLKRHRLYGKLIELRMADLIIDSHEYQLLLMLHEGELIENKSNILERSEGWVLGISMLLKFKAISDGSLKHDKADNMVIDMDFLIGEYMPQLPASFSEPLLLASVCDRFNEELLQALFQNHLEQTVNVPEFILKLKELNLFLISEDDSDEWFRFHHLFTEVLRKQQNLKKQNNNGDILLFISNWFAGKGFIEEAIGYAIRKGDLDAAISLVSCYRFEAFNKGEWWRIKSWLDLLPDNLIKTNPSLLIAKIWVLENFWNHSKIEHALFLLEKLIKTGNVGDQEKSEYYFHVGFHDLVFNSDPVKALKNARKSKSLYEDSQMLGARREMVISSSLQMQGKVEESLETMDEIEKTYNPGEVMYLRSFSTRLFVMLLSGSFTEAKEVSRRFNFIVQNTIKYMEAWSVYLAANVDFQNFQSSKSLYSLKNTMEYEGAMDWRAYMDSFAGISIGFVLSNDIEAAKKSLSKMNTVQQQIKDGIFTHIYVSTQMRIHWLLGEKEQALCWAATKLNLEMGSTGPLFMMEVPELTRIKILISYGNDEQLQCGLNMLKLFENLLHSVNNAYNDIDILLLNALAYYRMGDQKQSKIFLENAFGVYGKQKLTRPFREFMKVTPKLFDQMDNIPISLLRIISSNTMPAKELLILDKDKGNDSAKLSQREMEVANLTTHGLRNKEIADQLNISIATVKSHLSHIYQKLDVHNRTSMIQKIRNYHSDNS